MEKTYYTPSIEEFHVGFEFEWQGTRFLLGGAPTDWNKMTVGTNYKFRLDGIATGIESGYIRVKRLDREDIESCGWDADLDLIGYGIKGDAYNFALRPFIGGDFVEILKGEKMGRVFLGSIRNKSELIKVMQMIGVK